MRIVLRQLKGDETDWELVLGVLWTSLLLITIAVALCLPSDLIPVCRFRQVTGIACPTCGVYRSACLLLKGEWCQAFVTQPLALVTVALLIVYSVYSWVVVLGRMPRIRLSDVTRVQRSLLWLLGGLLILLNWAYLILDGR